MANNAQVDEQKARRESLLAEYSEVAANFRLLTDIRFKLLALLPVASGAAWALLSAGASRNGASEVRALILSLFGLLITIGLATYNDRNDQLYDTLVGRAASIEWQLGLYDGAFANRPAPWFRVRVAGPLTDRLARGDDRREDEDEAQSDQREGEDEAQSAPRRPVALYWPINHRHPVALIYGASVGLWVFGACAAARSSFGRIIHLRQRLWPPQSCQRSQCHSSGGGASTGNETIARRRCARLPLRPCNACWIADVPTLRTIGISGDYVRGWLEAGDSCRTLKER